jgi:hypothetical protein
MVTSPSPLGGFESPAEVLLFLPALSPPAALGVTSHDDTSRSYYASSHMRSID